MAGGVRGRLMRNGLVLAQVALTLVLLVGAGLLIQSFARLQAVDPGFEPKGVLTVKLELPQAKYPEPQRQIVFYRGLLERVRALPGVEHAGFLFPLPLGGGNMILAFSVAGRPDPPPNAVPSTNVRTATPGAFRALGIPLRRGRLFDERDNESGMPVLLVNETMAAQVWPNEDPLGKRISFDDTKDPKARWYTVVGVVGDVRHQALAEEAGSEAYWPQFQDPISSATLVVRGTGDPGGSDRADPGGGESARSGPAAGQGGDAERRGVGLAGAEPFQGRAARPVRRARPGAGPGRGLWRGKLFSNSADA